MNLRVIGHDSWKNPGQTCWLLRDGRSFWQKMHRHNFLAYLEQPGLPLLGSPKIDGYPHKKLVQFQCFASIKSQAFNLLSVQLNARLTENGRARGRKIWTVSILAGESTAFVGLGAQAAEIGHCRAIPCLRQRHKTNRTLPIRNFSASGEQVCDLPTKICSTCVVCRFFAKTT